MNFAWTVLKSRQSTLGLQGICSVESTELYLPHRLFLLQSKLKETETNRNCSKEMSLELQTLHNLFLQLKTTLIITRSWGKLLSWLSHSLCIGDIGSHFMLAYRCTYLQRKWQISNQDSPAARLSVRIYQWLSTKCQVKLCNVQSKCKERSFGRHY